MKRLIRKAEEDQELKSPGDGTEQDQGQGVKEPSLKDVDPRLNKFKEDDFSQFAMNIDYTIPAELPVEQARKVLYDKLDEFEMAFRTIYPTRANFDQYKAEAAKAVNFAKEYAALITPAGEMDSKTAEEFDKAFKFSIEGALKQLDDYNRDRPNYKKQDANDPNAHKNKGGTIGIPSAQTYWKSAIRGFKTKYDRIIQKIYPDLELVPHYELNKG